MGKISKENIVLLIIAVVHILLLLQIRFFPYPELMIYSYLTDSGMTPYLQIIDQHFPGIMFFPVNLYSLGIDTVPELRVVHLFLIACNHILIFLILQRITGSKKKALIANLLFLIWQPYYEGYVLWIESFATTLLLISAYFLVKNKDHFYGGLFLGLALLFKQVVAPLIVLILVYILLTSRQQIGRYLAGLSVSVLAIVLFVVYYDNWQSFYYWTFVFNITTFAQMGRKFVTMNELIRTLPIFGSAFIAITLQLVGKKKQNKPQKSTIKYLQNDQIVIFIYFVGSLFFAYARFDFVHLQPALVFAILILGWFFSSSSKAVFRLATFLFVLTSAIYLLPSFYRSNQTSEVAFFGRFEDKLKDKVQKYTIKGDKIFAMATTPHLYYLSDRMPPGGIFVFQFPWFMKEAEDDILNGILAEPPKLVVRDPKATVQGFNLISFMPNINTYINEHYTQVDNIQGTQILLRE